MNIKKLEFSLLPALYVLLKEQSVTRAADSLCISQSAMSKVLAQLRDSFNDELLVRAGKSYVLSHRAMELLSELDFLIPMTEKLWVPSKLDLHSEERLINIAGTDMDIAYISSKLDLIMSKAPKAGVSISMSHEHSLDELKKGDLDFLITAFKDTTSHLDRHSLAISDYVVVTSKNLGCSNMTLKKYLASEHVAFQFSNVRKSAADIELERLDLARKTVLWTANFHQAIRSIVHGRRELVLTLPRKFIESSEFINELKLFPVPFEIKPIELFLYWHKKSNSDPFLTWAKDLILA